MEGGQIDGAVRGEMFGRKLNEGDFSDNEQGVVGLDRDGFDKFQSETEAGFGDEGGVDVFFEMGGEAGGGEFGAILRVAGGALVGLLEDVGMDVVDGVGFRFEEIGEGVSLDDIRAVDEADEGGVRAKVNDAGKGGEVGFSGKVHGPHKGDGLRAREGVGELDADEFVHRFDVGGGDVFQNGLGGGFQAKVRTEESPPSGRRTWPVMKREASESRKETSWAMSSGWPVCWRGWRLAAASFFASLLSRGAASGVSVREGAMTLTRIFGASSAASERESPSTAAFAAAMEAWKAMPWVTAMVENRTMEAEGAFLSAGRACWITCAAARQLIWKSRRKSSGVSR